MKKPAIMGILNVTPNSFFDGGKHTELPQAIEKGKHLWKEGADILDIGGAPSHPGAGPVSEEEEKARVIPVIEELKKQVPIPLSIDTNKPGVASLAAEKGASLINDITGFTDPAMREIAAQFQTEVCVMHMQGSPQTMQLSPSYREGVVPEIMRFFEQQVHLLTQAGVPETKIILDPGIGFGKTLDHNIEIYKGIPTFRQLGFRILIGSSRKKHLSHLLNKPAKELLSATLAIHTISLLLGADLIRVHDVIEHKDMLEVTKLFLPAQADAAFSDCKESSSVLKD